MAVVVKISLPEGERTVVIRNFGLLPMRASGGPAKTRYVWEIDGQRGAVGHHRREGLGPLLATVFEDIATHMDIFSGDFHG